MLANQLEYRGNDATGIALMDTDGEISLYKHHEPAWRFTASQEFRDFIRKALTPKVHIALVHTRKYTKGSPFDNKNNHPIFAGKGCIIHNGMVMNDDALFTANEDKEGFKRCCETDSDIFRAILDNHGGIDKDLIADMGLVTGVAAVAAIHPNTPDKLLLLRDSNPLVLGATSDMLMFASDKTAIHKALKPWVRVHNIPMQVHAPDLAFVPMPNETGWIIGPKGYEDHDVFKCNGMRKTGNTKYLTSTDYYDRQKRLKDEAERSKAKPVVRTTTAGNPTSRTNMPDWVICPNPACSKHLQLGEDYKRLTGLAYLACGKCGTNLGGAIPADMIN
jgi:Glutamine amidotransferase domain